MALPGKRKSNPNTNNQKKLPTQDDFFSNVDDGNYLDDSDLQSNIQYNNQNQQPDYNMYQQQNYVPQTDYYEGTQDRALDSLKTRTPDRIDHKKKKIIPTGGERAKVNDKNLDDRKNTLVFLKAIRFVLLLVIFGLFGLGIKNTFFPAQIYTNEDIENIVKTSMGETGFPKDRGRAYAQEYLNTYLNSTQSKLSKDLLSKLQNNIDKNYNESAETSLSGKSITNATTFLQKPFYYPSLLSEKVYSLNSAVYKFSVFMTNSNGELVDRDGNLNGSWISFQVSVTYDEKTDSLSIVESPTLIPNYNINKTTNTFYYKKPGTGEQTDSKMGETLKSTILGFLEAYSKSSFKEHSALDQYIPHDKPIKLINGFNNTVKLESNTVNYKIYTSKKENEWKVDLTVSWLDLQSSNNSEGVKYQSHYLMTIQKTEDNVYLVTDFIPYPIIKDEQANDSSKEDNKNANTKTNEKK